MTRELRPYPEYKDSGLPWLGQIPARWRIGRTKQLFRLSIEKSKPNHGTELLSIYTHIGVRPRKELEERGNKATTTDGYWVVKKGDIIVNKLLAWMGAVGVSHYDGVTSPAYDILRPVRELVPDFYHHLFRTGTYLQQFKSRSRGIMDMRLRLYFDQFGQIPLPIPPLEEQRAIARFLQAYSRLVSGFIRNKRRLIELLNEQKQAIINRAVTRGLDPSVRLKASGIGGLGDVPENWIIKPLKRWAYINRRSLAETTDPGYEFRYIDIGSVKTGFLIEEPERLRFGNAPSRARRILAGGDTIISTVRTYLRGIYFVAGAATDLIASTGFAVLTPGPSVVPEALGVVIQSDKFLDGVTANSIGIAYPAIAETRLGAFHIALPPTEAEQHRLVRHIEIETEAIVNAIKRTQREIYLIQEYRTRLIGDAVMGKVDVRRLAPETVGIAAAEPKSWEEDIEIVGDQDADDLEPVEELADAD